MFRILDKRSLDSSPGKVHSYRCFIWNAKASLTRNYTTLKSKKEVAKRLDPPVLKALSILLSDQWWRIRWKNIRIDGWQWSKVVG